MPQSLPFYMIAQKKTDMHVGNYGNVAIYASNQQDIGRVKNILNTMPKQIVKEFEEYRAHSPSIIQSI